MMATWAHVREHASEQCGNNQLLRLVTRQSERGTGQDVAVGDRPPAVM
jgi:hypothetical protein